MCYKIQKKLVKHDTKKNNNLQSKCEDYKSFISFSDQTRKKSLISQEALDYWNVFVDIWS